MPNRLDVDALTGPAAPLEHCGKPMRWAGSESSWLGAYGSGLERTTSRWTCDCGATLHVVLAVPS